MGYVYDNVSNNQPGDLKDKIFPAYSIRSTFCKTFQAPPVSVSCKSMIQQRNYHSGRGGTCLLASSTGILES